MVNKYTQPGYLVFDLFSGSYSTGRAFMFLTEHRRCILGDKELYFKASDIVQLAEVFACEILNNDSEITGAPELVQKALLFPQDPKMVNAKKYSNV